MTVEKQRVCIETDLFLFEAPAGYQVVSLDEEAELVGSKDEFLLVSSYSIDDNSSEKLLEDFMNNVADAMLEAVNEPDLVINGKLAKNKTDSGLPIISLHAEAVDKSHFFDQYAVINKTVAIMATIEGDFENRTSSAEVEEAVHGLEFK